MTCSNSVTTNYTWDFGNRIVSAAGPINTGGQFAVTFKYDPFGRRIEKVSSVSGTTIYAYDGDNVIEQLNGSGAATARYTDGLGIDEPLEVYESNASYYYHADALGTITTLTKRNGSVVNTYTYGSFGADSPVNTETAANPFHFTGREFDPELATFGLYYYRARYYDPLFGRFLSEDPIGFQGGANFYRYVANNPANLTDATGLYTLKGFPPAQAAEMTIAIGQLAAKLRAKPCCIDPKVSQRIQDLLQPFNYGSGVTFVYQRTLPSPPGYVTCAEVNGLRAFLTNTVEVSEAALDGTCGCALPGTILHEATHLTWGNFFGPAPEAGAYSNGSRCFGPSCSVPPGLTTP